MTDVIAAIMDIGLLKIGGAILIVGLFAYSLTSRGSGSSESKKPKSKEQNNNDNSNKGV